jgi:DNA-directed RNA polymerase specialized sigma24 family protein
MPPAVLTIGHSNHPLDEFLALLARHEVEALADNWLYGVAHQTALQARRNASRRRAREKQVAEMREPATAEPDLWRDLRPLLDQELSRLPDSYREVIVLCDLEGKTCRGNRSRVETTVFLRRKW